MQKELKNLKVWKEGMDLAINLYESTKNFPKEYLQFLQISKGSLYELMTLCQLAERLKYLTKTQAEDIQKQLSRITAMLTGLIQSLQ